MENPNFMPEQLAKKVDAMTENIFKEVMPEALKHNAAAIILGNDITPCPDKPLTFEISIKYDFLTMNELSFYREGCKIDKIDKIPNAEIVDLTGNPLWNMILTMMSGHM